jgi:hypothetical protein
MWGYNIWYVYIILFTMINIWCLCINTSRKMCALSNMLVSCISLDVFSRHSMNVILCKQNCTYLEISYVIIEAKRGICLQTRRPAISNWKKASTVPDIGVDCWEYLRISFWNVILLWYCTVKNSLVRWKGILHL